METNLVGKFVIVRTYSAGVHAGFLVEKDLKDVVLSNAYRIWSWTQPKDNTGSLSAVAEHGVGPKSKIAGPVKFIILTEAIEIILASELAEQSIRAGQWSN